MFHWRTMHVDTVGMLKLRNNSTGLSIPYLCSTLLCCLGCMYHSRTNTHIYLRCMILSLARQHTSSQKQRNTSRFTMFGFFGIAVPRIFVKGKDFCIVIIYKTQPLLCSCTDSPETEKGEWIWTFPKIFLKLNPLLIPRTSFFSISPYFSATI